MGIFFTGRKIRQAVKNVGRLRQIIRVFAAHGFTDFVNRMNLGRYLPASIRAKTIDFSDRTIPESLRQAFEELGPTFVKLGQVLSTRPDLVPEAYIDEFKKLQDDVLPLPFDLVRKTIEEEFGKPLSQIFASMDPTPLAAASIAQVHIARLHTGEDVVIKVQRPEIRKTIETDISLLEFLAKLLERYVPESRVMNPEIIVAEFFSTLSFELDFHVEANNMEKIRKNMESIPEVLIPKVYRALCTRRVLTLERFQGIRISDVAALQKSGADLKKLVYIGSKAFFKSIMVDGLFHGDLHGGNLFVLPGDRLGIIDFGIVGRLSWRSRDQLVNMVMALMAEDYENLCHLYAELGNVSSGIDFEAFVRDVRNNLAPYMGLSLQEVNAGRVLIDATRIASRYGIRIPGDWMIVFKAILTVEGMGRQLDPEFDLLSAGNEFVKEMIKGRVSMDRLKREFFFSARELVDLVQVLPRQLKTFLRKWNANDFAFDFNIPELRELRKTEEKKGKRISEALIASAALISSAIFTLSPVHGREVWGLPILSFLCFIFFVIFMIRVLFR